MRQFHKLYNIYINCTDAIVLKTKFQQNTNAGNAGIFVRLMPTGLAYLREIGIKVVNDEILKINLPTITEAIDAGQVLCEIGVAPVKPAEFVIFQLAQFSGGTALVSE